MAKKVDRKNLGYFGEEFQLRAIRCLIEDKRFYATVSHIIDHNCFSNESLRLIVNLINERYKQAGVVATYGEIELMINNSITDEIRLQYALETLEAVKTADISGMDMIEETVEKFFKQINIGKAVNKAQDIIKSGDYKNYHIIEDLLSKALEWNKRDTYNISTLFDDIEGVLREDYRRTIPTGTPELDESLYGGLGRGELGIITAPVGCCKTSLCVGLGMSAALSQCKVLHFFTEDIMDSIKRKYYGNLLDMDAMYLSTPEVRPIAIEKLKEIANEHKEFKNNIMLERIECGELTASDIKKKINTYIAKGFKPDLIIIDSFDCLKPENNRNSEDYGVFTQQGITMRKLENICHNLDVAMWVTTTAIKSVNGQDFVGMMHTSGSVSKVAIGHIVLTMARTEEQKAQGRLNVFIQKLRAVKLGRDKFLNVKFNCGTGKFDMSDIDDIVYMATLQSKQNAIARQERKRVRKSK